MARMGVDVSIGKLRAWWAHRQGLDGSLAGASPADVLARSGWARSIGGSGPYLGLFARAGLDRETVDRAVADLEILELPSARGCTYVLPRQDFTLGLTVGAGAPEGDIAIASKHLDVTRAEIEKLCGAVLDALDRAGEPLDPARLRDAVGDAVRSLGEEGKKRGISTTLPMALGLLQARGEIRRVPVTGRLDQQRFSYTRWAPSPLSAVEPDREEARTGLAERYFSWAAPASLAHFRWFSGLTVASAKNAIAPLDLRPLGDTDLLIPAGLAAEFAEFTATDKPSYSLVPTIDGIHLLHRDLSRLLDPADAERPSPGAKSGKTLGREADPPSPIIVDRGRITGLWEFDADAGEIAYQSFTGVDAELEQAVARTEAFIRDQLGDARMSSLDSPKSRTPRLAALRDS
jgi:hypothetical protein